MPVGVKSIFDCLKSAETSVSCRLLPSQSVSGLATRSSKIPQTLACGLRAVRRTRRSAGLETRSVEVANGNHKPDDETASGIPLFSHHRRFIVHFQTCAEKTDSADEACFLLSSE